MNLYSQALPMPTRWQQIYRPHWRKFVTFIKSAVLAVLAFVAVAAAAYAALVWSFSL